MRPNFKHLTLEKWAALVTIIGFPLLLVSLYYAAHQDGVIITSVDKLRAIARSQNNIALSQMFFGDPRDEKLLSEEELCGSFSVYAQEAEGNPEIKDYLKKNPQYFSGLPKLFDVVDHSQNQYCRD